MFISYETMNNILFLRVFYFVKNIYFLYLDRQQKIILL